MAEAQEAANAATPETANAGEEANQSGTEAQAPVEGTAARILEESKKYKARMLAAEKELESLRKSKLSEQGEYRKLYEAEVQKSKTLFENLAKKEIHNQVASVAAKAGCHDIDALLKLGKAELLELDTESMSVSGSDAFVEEAKKRYPWLFSTQKPAAINPASPHGAVRGDKSLKQLSKEDIMAKLRSLK